MPGEVHVNHIGHAVADLDRAARFWTGVFGFEEVRRLEAPDEGTAQLLGVAPPVGLHAVYLRRDDFVLELLHFVDAGLEERPARVFNESGLTHISLLVDDLDRVLARVRDFGGSVLEETRLADHAVVVLDPDGQRIELLTAWTKP